MSPYSKTLGRNLTYNEMEHRKERYRRRHTVKVKTRQANFQFRTKDSEQMRLDKILGEKDGNPR